MTTRNRQRGRSLIVCGTGRRSPCPLLERVQPWPTFTLQITPARDRRPGPRQSWTRAPRRPDRHAATGRTVPVPVNNGEDRRRTPPCEDRTRMLPFGEGRTIDVLT